MTAEQLEKHLHTLRTNYGKWTKPDAISGSGYIPKNPRHVALMSRLRFLDEHIQSNRKTISSLDQDDTDMVSNVIGFDESGIDLLVISLEHFFQSYIAHAFQFINHIIAERR